MVMEVFILVPSPRSLGERLTGLRRRASSLPYGQAVEGWRMQIFFFYFSLASFPLGRGPSFSKCSSFYMTPLQESGLDM